MFEPFRWVPEVTVDKIKPVKHVFNHMSKNLCHSHLQGLKSRRYQMWKKRRKGTKDSWCNSPKVEYDCLFNIVKLTYVGSCNDIPVFIPCNESLCAFGDDQKWQGLAQNYVNTDTYLWLSFHKVCLFKSSRFFEISQSNCFLSLDRKQANLNAQWNKIKVSISWALDNCTLLFINFTNTVKE